MSAEVAGPVDLAERAASVARMFADRVAAVPDREAFRYPAPGDADTWHSVTWREAGARVDRLAAGLLELGIRPQERVAIAAATTYSWILADLAIMSAGAAVTTVYPTTTIDEVGFILGDSQSRVIFADDADQVAKLTRLRSQLPDVLRVVCFDPGAADRQHAADGGGAGDGSEDGWVLSLDDLERLGCDHLAAHPEAIARSVDAIRPESLATLIYTSGATGRPKGVELTHDSWTFIGASIGALELLDLDDLQYLWLPLAHVFGQALVAAQLQVGFPTAVDGRVDRIVDNLGVVRPTFMGAAPRIFEKAHARIVTTIEQDGGLKARLFGWALRVGHEVSQRRQEGHEPGGMLAVRHRIADRLVLSRIRARFGGRLRFFVSGSAALSREVGQWFHDVGILVLEGYGLTETSAATCLNLPHRYQFGTVGLPFPGTRIRIAADGEVLVQGPGVMQGYHDRPETTAEVLDADGWFHTGDIGEIRDGDLLAITDRKKDVFKTSGGKYIAPQLIEARFKAICPYVSHVLVHGERRNYCTALVTLDPEAIVDWAGRAGVGTADPVAVTRTSAAREMIQGYVDELNATLNRWETIKKFTILERDLSVEDGEVTPSLKVRRGAVERRYTDVLDALYR